MNEHCEWTYVADELEPGDEYSFRYRQAGTHSWIEATDPLARRYTQNFDWDTKQYDLLAIVPRRTSAAAAAPPPLTHGLCVCECTLPGLAARWPGRRPAGRSKSLAGSILGTGLPERLRASNCSAVMFPLQASAANIDHFNWKYSYLITGLGAIHNQLGDWDEIRALVDEFHRSGILVIADLVLVHLADKTSPRAPYAIRDAHGQLLWFDHQANRPVDFGTYMLRWEDPRVRRSISELLVRFIDELGLGAYRFDFVDGLIRQYESRSTNFGALLLNEMRQLLCDRGVTAWCLSEAFATRGHPSVLAFADILYQPWVGFDSMKAGLTPPDDQSPWRFSKVRDGLVGATGSRQPRPTLGYALAHDEAGRDEGVLQNHRNDRGEAVSVGGHLAQLALEFAHKLPPGRGPAAADRLTFVADRVALLEGTALLGADFSYLTLGDFADYLKLGSYDDPDAWQMLWSADDHPDLAAWCNETGQSPHGVADAITRHAARMARLRGLFITYTPLSTHPVAPMVDVTPLPHRGDPTTLVWSRFAPEHATQALVVIANFALHDLPALEIQLPPALHGDWQVLAGSISNVKQPVLGAAFATDNGGTLRLPVSANSLVVLGRPAVAPGP